MSIDDRGRRAANEMRNSRRDAKFSVKSPAQSDGPSLWPVLGVAIFAIVALIGLNQLLGNEPEEVVDSTVVETTIPTTTMPPTTQPPSTTGPSTTGPATTTAPTTTQPETTTAPTTTQPPTTTAPNTTQPTVEIPERALAFAGPDLVWVDTNRGEVEMLHQALLEAEYPSRLQLGPQGDRAYYHVDYEDSWFSCDTVSGEVVMVDLQSGTTTTLGTGIQALSPDGTRLAYLTTDECFPDPEQPDFFLSVFDTLVVTDADGNELLSYGLEGEAGTQGSPVLENLVWSDDETLLVRDETGTTYRIPVNAGGSELVTDHETVDLPEHHLYEVTDGTGIGAIRPDLAPPGPLESVDLDTGATASLPDIPEGFDYHVGVSTTGAVIVGYSEDQANTLAVVDLATGQTITTFSLPGFLGGVDW